MVSFVLILTILECFLAGLAWFAAGSGCFLTVLLGHVAELVFLFAAISTSLVARWLGILAGFEWFQLGIAWFGAGSYLVPKYLDWIGPGLGRPGYCLDFSGTGLVLVSHTVGCLDSILQLSKRKT